MRYFRSMPEVYSGICQQLDAAYGYPNDETKTARTLPPVADLPIDGVGRVYIAIESAYCEYVLPAELLPQLIASGEIEEINAEAYSAVLPKPPPGRYGR
jgi:hypothetical protein